VATFVHGLRVLDKRHRHGFLARVRASGEQTDVGW
jgi:hypothetical protein